MTMTLTLHRGMVERGGEKSFKIHKNLAYPKEGPGKVHEGPSP